MAIHALASMSSLTALCGTQASGQPIWLQVIQAAGGIATTVGVLIALYIALIREPKEASAEHSHHVAQMDIIRRARSERIGGSSAKTGAVVCQNSVARRTVVDGPNRQREQRGDYHPFG
jgi:hypothetical protein